MSDEAKSVAELSQAVATLAGAVSQIQGTLHSVIEGCNELQRQINTLQSDTRIGSPSLQRMGR